MTTALRDAGLKPVWGPVLTRHRCSDAREEIGLLAPTDWLVLTSAYAVNTVAVDVARVPRVAVVGEASRRAAADLGLRVEIVGTDGGAAELFRQVREHARGTTVCYPRSSLAQVPEVPGADRIVAPVIYETAARPFRREIIDEVDVVAVASPSAVRAIGPVDLPFASIGRTTTAALAEIGITPWVEAPTPGFVALARAIAERGGA
ncbi:MAG: hypothetical protein GY715_09725 [Planctomycetes bacterium]|nr:hypothetical protein [Planctomycetota bacterium]